MKYYFDLSSSSRWGGSAVGIIRVERELAKHARQYLGQKVEFCVYDQVSKQFFHVPDNLASGIFEGQAHYLFDEPVRVERPAKLNLRGIVSNLSNFWPEEASYQLLQRPRLYRLLQRLRGRRLSFDDVKRLRADRERAMQESNGWSVARDEARRLLLQSPRVYQILHQVRGRRIELEQVKALKNTANAPRRLVSEKRYASDHFNVPINLDENCTVISGGLDWDHKHLRDIYKLKKRLKFKYTAIVYDLIPVNYPHFVVPGYDTLLRDFIGELVWLADRMLCISETTRQDLTDYAYRNGVADIDAIAFPLGNDLPKLRAPDPENSMNLMPDTLQGRQFGLFVSTIEPRKNHRVLYEAWDRCVRDGLVDPTRDCLVFVGRRGWGTDDLLREIETNPATKNSILILNHVSDEMLAELYKKSAFSLFPSHYEGYGLPLAEALLAGKASFASDAGALAEIGGDLVVRIDPKDAPAWAECLARAMNEQEYVAKLSKRIVSDFRPTTWAASAKTFFSNVTRPAL